MPNLRALEVVHQILENFPECRDNDNLLFLRTARSLYPDLVFKDANGEICLKGRTEISTLACSVKRYRAKLVPLFPHAPEVQEELDRRAEAHRELHSPSSHP